MGIRLLYAKPYSPEATGKPERFNRLVDSFLAEVPLEKPQSLDRLNQLFAVWLEECYQHKPHTGLSGNITPYAAYHSDKHPLKYIDPETLANAFMHCEERKVDKSGCISFEGRKYEVGLNFIGCKVSVIYDPADTSELTIEYESHEPFRVRQMVIGEHSGKRPRLPEHLLPEPADSSRLLSAAAKKNQERMNLPSQSSPTEKFGRRAKIMFEGFYGFNRTPFQGISQQISCSSRTGLKRPWEDWNTPRSASNL